MTKKILHIDFVQLCFSSLLNGLKSLYLLALILFSNNIISQDIRPSLPSTYPSITSLDTCYTTYSNEVVLINGKDTYRYYVADFTLGSSSSQVASLVQTGSISFNNVSNGGATVIQPTSSTPSQPPPPNNNNRNQGFAVETNNVKKYFLSYSHEDEKYALELKNKLEEQGHIVWMDSASIEPGNDYREAIDNAIRNAMAVIVLMTPASRKSEYVAYEWAFAFGCKVRVIPLMFKKTSIHSRLEPLHYLDFSYKKKQPWDLLINTLNKLS